MQMVCHLKQFYFISTTLTLGKCIFRRGYEWSELYKFTYLIFLAFLLGGYLSCVAMTPPEHFSRTAGGLQQYTQ